VVAVRPTTSDYVWAAVATVVAVVALVSAGSLVNAVVAPVTDATLGLLDRVVSPLFALGWFAAYVWVAAGAWRRTVWGCLLPASAESGCPRHGFRCRPARVAAVTARRP
jgi:heme exporter protein D